MSARVLYDFNAEAGTELTVKDGESLTIVSKDVGEGWWLAKNANGDEGMVPASYVQELDPSVLYQDVPDDDESFSSDAGSKDEPWPELGHPTPTYFPEQHRIDSRVEGGTLDQSRNSQSSCSNTASEPPNGTLKKAVGKDLNRLSTYIKLGVEDYIIGNVSKKVDEKRYIVEDMANTVEWFGGVNHSSDVSISATNSKSKLGGLKKFIAYSIKHVENNGNIERRYKQFDWLEQRLNEQFPCSLRPNLPEKQASGRFEIEFIERRKELLEAWLIEVCRHPIISRSPIIEGFVTIPLEAEKGMQWKSFKRKQESTAYKISGFWQSVTVPQNSRFIEDGKTQIVKFQKFAKGFDAANTMLANALRKSLKIHMVPKKDELESVAHALTKLSDEFAGKKIRPGAAELAQAVGNAADTFRKSSEITCEWVQQTTIPLLDQLWIYSGILSRVPSLIETAEQSQQKIKNNQNKVGAGTPEFRELEAKGNTVNGVILAEADYLNQIRIPDYSRFLKTYLESRAAHHRKQMEMFEAAAALFPDF